LTVCAYSKEREKEEDKEGRRERERNVTVGEDKGRKKQGSREKKKATFFFGSDYSLVLQVTRRLSLKKKGRPERIVELGGSEGRSLHAKGATAQPMNRETLAKRSYDEVGDIILGAWIT
jgi:hypothetical protein